MSKQDFIKRNFNLVIGVSLPVLLVLLFWIATVIPNWTVDPPQHDLVFMTNYYDYNAQVKGQVRFDVKNGKMRAFFHAAGNQEYRQVPRLYYFNVKTESTREIALDFPEDLNDGAAVRIPDLEEHTFSNESLSPDGYTFDNSHRGHRGFFFFDGGHRYQSRIEKNGRTVKIPMPGGNPGYQNLRFLGWVLERES